ncbi:MAG: hypothetical protein ACI81Y_002461, partial [Glaciecola sp.]
REKGKVKSEKGKVKNMILINLFEYE